MKEIEDIVSFMNRVITVVNQLKIYGEEIKDQIMVEKVLRCLSSEFNVVVAATEEAMELASLTVDELMGSLLSHEARIDRNNDSTFRDRFQKSGFYFKRLRSRQK